MKLYKKVVPYVLAGSALVFSGCLNDHKDVVVAKQSGKLYLDRNNDGLCDAAILFPDTVKNLWYRYTVPGDLLHYSISSMADGPVMRLDKIQPKEINGVPYAELQKISQIDSLRQELNQPNTHGR
jgi:hypothetical protein